MSDFLAALQARASGEAIAPAAPEPVIAPAGGIQWSMHGTPEPSRELDRILALPRREPTPTVELAAEWTQRLRRPGGTMVLRPIQAMALRDAVEMGGLLGPIGVGEGKGLLSMLLPVAMGVKTAVLLIPPQLRDQVQRLHAEYAAHFKVANLKSGVLYPDVDALLHVLSYSELSSAKATDALERLGAELVICDEAHYVKSTVAARTKRFLRYLRQRPDTKLVALSGTLVSKSIRDFWHFAKHALHDGAPVPLSWPEVESWCAALDPGEFRTAPGALTRLCKDESEDVREGFRRRLVETPGVVASSVSRLNVGLEIHEAPTKCPPEVEKALQNLRDTWCIGDEEIVDALTFSRKAREVSAGLYLRWIWPNGEPEDLRAEWIDRRKEFHRWLRKFLSDRAAPGLDSPLLVTRAIIEGRVQCAEWSPWAEIKDQAEPQTEAVWISKWLADEAAEWGRKHTGVIWYVHSEFGREVAQRGNYALYEGGDEDSQRLLNERGDRTIVASLRAFGTGFNLQMFSEQLFTTTPANGANFTQALGRMHRPGQTADTVTAYVYRHTAEMCAALEKAKDEARFIQQVTGQDQKLLQATYSF